MAGDAVDQVERVLEADAARDDLLGGGQQGGARHGERAVAARLQDAELDRAPEQLERVFVGLQAEAGAELGGVDDPGRFALLARLLEREHAVALVGEQALDAVELEALVLQLLDQLEPLDVLRAVEALERQPGRP
jgi:hypothetical protein